METVTFGAPKFTDFAGSVQYIKHQVPLLRITNKGDPVPAGPPWDDYVHAGAEVSTRGPALVALEPHLPNTPLYQTLRLCEDCSAYVYHAQGTCTELGRSEL